MAITEHLILIIWFGIKLSISILKKDENEQATLDFGSSYRNDDYYYYSITVHYDNVYTFIETVSN